jgi:hypothetical protein
MDVDSIEPGADFAAAINSAVASCGVLLALIGPNWLDAQDEQGKRRLNDPDDFVVVEITAALRRNVHVLPVLVDGAAPPHATRLPETLTPLARRNAMRLDHETFRSDVDALGDAVAKIIGSARTPRRSDRPQGSETRTRIAGRSDKDEAEGGRRLADLPAASQAHAHPTGSAVSADSATGLRQRPDKPGAQKAAEPDLAHVRPARSGSETRRTGPSRNAEDASATRPPRLFADRYELRETIGYGGMSELHRGVDTRLGRDVMVKIFRADMAREPQFQLRFRQAAQNAVALNHSAIVAVYDTGEVHSDLGSLLYVVMEYVDGHTLREIVKTQGSMSQQRVIEVMSDVCAALDFTHRQGMIHRDVKPANIMINSVGAVKVMGFGIARAGVIGTAHYLSPEQARGEAVDTRSDVYAAGCVLFELLTGEPPFTGDTPVVVAYQHVGEDPRRPSELNPAISPALDAIVLKALTKNPANRYQSAAEMLAHLMRVRSRHQPLAPMGMSEDERIGRLNRSTGHTRGINGSGTRYAPSVAPPCYGEHDGEPGCAASGAGSRAVSRPRSA